VVSRNGRLAAALTEAGYSTSRLAGVVDVDAKTVERWVTQGRVPHPRHRAAVAKITGVDPAMLWPDTTAVPTGAAPQITVYPSRRAVPAAVWRALVAGTQHSFDLHAFAATFLPDQMDLAAELLTLADRDVTIRLLLGDPAGGAVAQRSEEEGGSGLAGRVSLVLSYLRPALAHPRVQVRLHDSTLYASLYRFDDDLLVNTHVWGSPAAANPILHLHAERDAAVAGVYQGGFERVWETATPYLPFAVPSLERTA
jgi:lambda repressor-like predicted transcriptional regulator